MTVKLYGIKNCDTVRKARRWLNDNNIDFDFRDIRDAPLSKQDWTRIASNSDHSVLINTRGTSWRKLSEEERDLSSVAKLVTLLLKHPTVMKRPLLITDNEYHIGFKPEKYSDIFS